MSLVGLDVRYRPLRFGLCVRSDSIEDVRQAIRLAHVLWGGKHNPILPVGSFELSKRLARAFNVDALLPVFDTPINPDDHDFRALADSLKHLPWPFTSSDGLFRPMAKGKSPLSLSIQHPTTKLCSFLDQNAQYAPSVLHPVISEADPLLDVLLATIGDFPNAATAGQDYHPLLTDLLDSHAQTWQMAEDASLEKFYQDQDSENSYLYTLNQVTAVGLRASPWSSSHRTFSYMEGVYIGDAEELDDIVEYWNLRASGRDVLFYDPSHSDRLDALIGKHIEKICSQPEDEEDSWSPDQIPPSAWISSSIPDEADLSKSLPFSTSKVQPVKSAYRDIFESGFPYLYAGNSKRSVLASTDENSTQASFELPERPFDIKAHQSTAHYVVSVRPQAHPSLPEGQTLRVPDVPDLGAILSSHFSVGFSTARVERGAIGVVIPGHRDHLTVRATRTRKLAHALFSLADIEAEASKEGRIAHRLIQQMGGLQGCRVFKVEGVRELLNTYSPYQHFESGAAALKIGQFKEGEHPNLEQYSDIFLDPGKRVSEMGPSRIFNYLLRKDIFRAGLPFDCPKCGLDLWRHLDQIGSSITCEYCGNVFDPTLDLDGKNWTYRRSGLFGRSDGNNQGGAIPVILTLMQLDTLLSSDWTAFSTGTELGLPGGLKCETDFVFLAQSRQYGSQIVLSECKSHMSIEESDVNHLRLVANALHEAIDDLTVFLSFSKLGDFSEDELDLFHALRENFSSRIILLSKQQLEPYNVLRRAPEDIQQRIVGTLSGLAGASSYIHLGPPPTPGSIPVAE